MLINAICVYLMLPISADCYVCMLWFRCFKRCYIGCKLRRRGRSRVRSKEERKSKTSGEGIGNKPKVEKKSPRDIDEMGEDVLKLLDRPRQNGGTEKVVVHVDVGETQPTYSEDDSVPSGIGHVSLEKC